MADFTRCTPADMSLVDFVEQFKDVYEHSPWVAQRAYAQGISKECNDVATLQNVFAHVMLTANKDEQLALIHAHPDLAGKAAIAGELTAASTAEQAGAGIHQCNAKEFAEFTALNEQYKSKFGFPFIKAVKGSNRFEILAAFRQRINNDAETEFKQALLEINKIAAFRLAEM